MKLGISSEDLNMDMSTALNAQVRAKLIPKTEAGTSLRTTNSSEKLFGPLFVFFPLMYGFILTSHFVPRLGETGA